MRFRAVALAGYTTALISAATLGLSGVAAPAQAQSAAAVRVSADPLRPTSRWTANARGNAPTPPMGWNSWNAFGIHIDEAKVIGTAQALVDTGLAGLGYRYVNIDDGWWLRRRASDGRMQVRTNMFPSASVGGAEETSFRPLVDRLHGMGLRAGIYTDIGRNSCGQSYEPAAPNNPVGTIAEREIGLYGHMEQDIQLYFGDWGFDFVKVDACGIDDNSEAARHSRGATFATMQPYIFRNSIAQTNIAGVQRLYRDLGDALARANPDNDYVYSLCLWGSANVRAWGKDVGSMTRTSDDIRPTWSRMLHTFDTAANRPLYAQPGSWNDPDMLFVGHGDFDVNHLTEARSHFALWAIINAPLLIGFDMRDAPQSLLDIWGNPDLVAANQDPGGHQAVIAYASDDLQILVKTLAGTDRKVVAIFNRSGAPVEAVLLAQHLKFAADAPIALRGLWSGAQLEPFTGERALRLAPRETLVFEATGTRALADGMYVSELPGRVNVAHDGVVTPQADPSVHLGLNPWNGSRSSGERPIYGGWGGAQADASPFGQRIAIATTPYDSGIGILGNSRLEVRNDAEFKRFSAMVGVDANSRNLGALLSFLVYADGKLVARSPRFRFGDQPFALTADIAGARIVELVVRQHGDAANPASAAWGNAALLR